MRAKILILLSFLVFSNCTEEEVPPGLWHYQVERLLSGGSTKTWTQVVNSTVCTDSVFLLISEVNASSADSLDISAIVRNAACTSYDTSYVGRANASFPTDGNILFTDSLIFSDGDFWIVDRITSEFFDVNIEGNNFSYRF